MILNFIVGLGVTIVAILICIAVMFLFGLLVHGVDKIKETKIGKLMKLIGKIINKILTVLFFSLIIFAFLAFIYQLGEVILK